MPNGPCSLDDTGFPLPACVRLRNPVLARLRLDVFDGLEDKVAFEHLTHGIAGQGVQYPNGDGRLAAEPDTAMGDEFCFPDRRLEDDGGRRKMLMEPESE